MLIKYPSIVRLNFKIATGSKKKTLTYRHSESIKLTQLIKLIKLIN